MVILRLTKYCPSCGKDQPIFKGDNCHECLKYWHDQWYVQYGPKKESNIGEQKNEFRESN